MKALPKLMQLKKVQTRTSDIAEWPMQNGNVISLRYENVATLGIIRAKVASIWPEKVPKGKCVKNDPTLIRTPSPTGL